MYIQLARSAQYRMSQIIGTEAELTPAHEQYFVEALYKAVLGWRPAAQPRPTAAQKT